MLHIPT